MKFIAKVYEPMYEFNDKKYIRLVIPPKAAGLLKDYTRKAPIGESKCR